MTVVGTVAKDGLFRAKASTVKRAQWKTYQQLLRSQHDDPEAIVRQTMLDAAAMARHAAATTPFYRDLYADAGLGRADLDDPDLWTRLPLLTKEMVREHGASMRSSVAPDNAFRPTTTGGSSGIPLRSFHDTRSPTRALAWRQLTWWGVSPASDVAEVFSFHRRGSPGWRSRAQNALWWPTRRVQTDASAMTEESLLRFTDQLRRVRPQVISGWVGALEEYARFVLDRGLAVPTPRAVVTTAAMLGEPQRRLIQEALGAPVYDEYGSGEIAALAAECSRQDGLHMSAEARLIEILDDSGQPAAPGQRGEVVVTDLWNRAFPLVRYRLGDLSALRTERCSCGVTLPLMDKVHGRLFGVARLPDGRSVAGRLSSVFSHDPDAVRQFQVWQHPDYSVSLRVVPTGEDSAASIERAAARVREMLFDAVPVRVEVVPEIRHEAGKVKLVFSEVPPPTRAPA